jgi:hypothetical protein
LEATEAGGGMATGPVATFGAVAAGGLAAGLVADWAMM